MKRERLCFVNLFLQQISQTLNNTNIIKLTEQVSIILLI